MLRVRCDSAKPLNRRCVRLFVDIGALPRRIKRAFIPAPACRRDRASPSGLRSGVGGLKTCRPRSPFGVGFRTRAHRSSTPARCLASARVRCTTSSPGPLAALTAAASGRAPALASPLALLASRRPEVQTLLHTKGPVMSAANHQPSNATTHAGFPPAPSATHQGAADGKATRIREMNGSRLLMVWTGPGWVNHVVGPAPFNRAS
jgi:hypothetical protein